MQFLLKYICVLFIVCSGNASPIICQDDEHFAHQQHLSLELSDFLITVEIDNKCADETRAGIITEEFKAARFMANTFKDGVKEDNDYVQAFIPQVFRKSAITLNIYKDAFGKMTGLPNKVTASCLQIKDCISQAAAAWTDPSTYTINFCDAFFTTYTPTRDKYQECQDDKTERTLSSLECRGMTF
ncbi:hypothetical protein MMC06_006623 [Schaereria dolodes]|nr:hypothetical protein [Schaereria dolodes]